MGVKIGVTWPQAKERWLLSDAGVAKGCCSRACSVGTAWPQLQTSGFRNSERVILALATPGPTLWYFFPAASGSSPPSPPLHCGTPSTLPFSVLWLQPLPWLGMPTLY